MVALAVLRRAFPALAALLLLALPAMAQEPPPRGNTISATLVAAAPRVAPGQSTTLAIAMQPRPGWHGYWINPGDAGLPLTVDWQLPAGVAIGPLRFPTPDTLIVQGIMNHIYKGDYAVLADLRVADGIAPGTALPIRGRARWLSCSDSLCVPEEGDIGATLIAGSGPVDAATGDRFARWQAALPAPLGTEARHQRRGDRIEIAIPWPAAADASDPHLFTVAQDVVAHGAAQHVRRAGDFLIVAVDAGGDAVPDRIDALLRLGGDAPRGLSFVSRSGTVPAGGVPVAGPGGAAGDADAARLTLLFGAALLGGVLLNLMPCVFPILGLKAISLARAGTAARAARRDALFYLAGSLIACLALGGTLLALRAGGAELGWAFQLQDPRIVFLLFLLLAAITANLAGLFEIRAIAVGSGIGKSGGSSGSFWTGALAAVVATPCTGPFMAAALGAALVLPWQAAMLLFAGLGIGLALPFVVIAYVERLRALLPRPGPWLGWFRRAMALPMLATTVALGWLLARLAGSEGLAVALAAVALLIGGLALLGARQAGKAVRAGRWWSAGAIAALALVAFVPPDGRAEAAAGDGLPGSQPFSEARLAALTAEGRPVFAYFTADWCITCKANEAVALNRPEVTSALAERKVAVLRADFTRADPAIARFLAANGRSGVPYYLYVDPQGRRTELPQILTPATVIAAIDG